MDLTQLMSTMMSSDVVKGISKRAGTTQKGTKNVLVSALPSMLNGAKAQADDASTVASFVNALSDHAGDNISDLG